MRWTENFSYFIRAMTWGQNYGGERYWQEEEEALRKLAQGRDIRRCLNIGCGLFRELETLRGIVKEEIIGIDHDARFIDYINAHLIPQALPKASALQLDLFNVDPKVMGRFDWVLILFNTLGGMPDMEAALCQAYSLVRTGGELIVSVWDDKPQTIRERMEIYTQVENKTAKVEYNAVRGIDEIVVYREGTAVGHFGILPRETLATLARACALDPHFIETPHVRIMRLMK